MKARRMIRIVCSARVARTAIIARDGADLSGPDTCRRPVPTPAGARRAQATRLQPLLDVASARKGALLADRCHRLDALPEPRCGNRRLRFLVGPPPSPGVHGGIPVPHP